MKTTTTFKRKLIDGVTMFVVTGLSLILLIYVGFGEAQRTYQQFHLEKLVAQGRVVQSVMENYLRPGLPLRQYVGFAALAGRILESDKSIAAMTAFDEGGRPVFGSGEESIPLLPAESVDANRQVAGYEVRQTDRYLQVVLPLRNRFERVGSLAITIPRSVVTETVAFHFAPLLYIAAGLSVVFALFVALSGRRLAERRVRLAERRVRWLQIYYALTFLSMAVVVVGTLIALYSEGAQAKTKALADSLGQRLTDIVRFNLNIEEIHGLERTFVEYRRLNPDISAAGLTVDGQIRIHTNSRLVGKRWVSDSSTYEYVVDLTPPQSVREIRIAVAMPISTVYNRTLRSVKNFAALFVASAFLAGLFLQIAAAMQRSRTFDETSAGTLRTSVDDEAALSLVKPVFFVAVFLEHLNYAFLPQFVERVVAASGLSAGYVSAPFIAYYLCFALALVPSGHFAQHSTPRPLIYVGLLLAAIGLFTLALQPDFVMVMVARSLSGIGQGMLFIGVQSYILAMALPSKKTQGAAIIVFGFQGGMISGMAIGSLLVAYLGAKGVFIVAGITALAMALYAVGVVPVAIGSGQPDHRRGMSLRDLGRSIAYALRSLEFLKMMFLIGVPAKAVLTGIIIFALPLLLAQMHYPEEDIGQIIMVYAAGVVLASVYVSRLVDRIGHTRTILFWGSALSGFGLVLIGLIGWEPLGAGPHGSTLVTAVLIAGVATVGVAHGFINAPVVTHVAESSLAMKVGASSATATYRFLERIGHIAGPIIVGQMFLVFGQNALSLTWVGGAIALFGLLFLLRFAPARAKKTKQEIPA